MSLPVAFHRAASAEFAEAGAWYEHKREGLGNAFIAEIERCAEVAAENPLSCAIAYGDVRSVVARRFPYSVFFRLEDRRIVVLGVFHSRRDPAIWRRR